MEIKIRAEGEKEEYHGRKRKERLEVDLYICHKYALPEIIFIFSKVVGDGWNGDDRKGHR